MNITLPWPPSVNHYWRAVKGRTLISAKGRAYRRMVQHLALVHGWESLGEARIRAVITANPPDRRRRDLDNLLKAVLDALQAAAVYDDDGQIDDIRITRGEVVAAGSLVINMEVMI